MPPCASLAEDFPEVGLPAVYVVLMALVGREGRVFGATVETPYHLRRLQGVGELVDEIEAIQLVSPAAMGLDVVHVVVDEPSVDVDPVSNFAILDDEDSLVNRPVHVARTSLVGAERDVSASDGRCFFGAGGRGCHCGWYWTQARPGASGRASFPSVGICGPLSPASVEYVYNGRTIKLFQRWNSIEDNEYETRPKDARSHAI